tara:strand:+ start:262 stop:471 length:210 start_codon:yes stop_codon:yes gene_type:complete
MDNPLRSSKETAEQLQICNLTLGNWAYMGKGPRFLKIGRLRKYRQSDIDLYLGSCKTGGGTFPQPELEQ